MSIQTFETIITGFLKNDIPEVAVLYGPWGVGKTYVWNNLVRKHKNEIKLPYYSYVSLFGINSIRELKNAIFVNKKSANELDINNTKKQKFKKLWSIFSKSKVELPYSVQNLSLNLLDSYVPNLIKDAIICLDDFEGLSSHNLNIEELIAFISELKDEKNCKVLLIFNEEIIDNHSAYLKYKDKLVDIELQYSPSAEEAAELSIPKDLIYGNMLKKHLIALKINNIRILKRIVNLTQLITPVITPLHCQIKDQVLMSLVLFVWWIYFPGKNKPPIDFLKKWNVYNGSSYEYNNSEEKANLEIYAKILQSYGIKEVDELDLSLLKVIQYGFLEETGFIEQANASQMLIQDKGAHRLTLEAWGVFNNSFDHNEDKLLTLLSDNVKKNILTVSALELNHIVILYKNLGRREEAESLIRYYIETHSGEEQLFDISTYSFSHNISDPTIKEMFQEKYNEIIKENMPLTEAVSYIIEHNSYLPIHFHALNNATVKDYIDFFKLEHGSDLTKIIKACLFFGNKQEEKYFNIHKKVMAALSEIGKESKLNALRVKTFGISVE